MCWFSCPVSCRVRCAYARSAGEKLSPIARSVKSRPLRSVGVGGVTVLTQKPTVVTARTGETATMDCNLGTVTASAARWYKQIPGAVPQFVLRFYRTNSSPTYGSGFSSPKFTSTHQSTSDYRLIINTVQEGDSAVYYCSTWDGTVNQWVSR
ncbi:hypothetical protein F2P81_015057 [Scophthalmus maximus]|uniref:Ig-like domain-containing protein n=1 Tax=Scophthalmus maximus TaxID=52904 RepID=A0A6A4SHR1_SCOMX|nr:hypothetical protein F2P81_015057 [Scophthalmus maximus]